MFVVVLEIADKQVVHIASIMEISVKQSTILIPERLGLCVHGGLKDSSSVSSQS